MKQFIKITCVLLSSGIANYALAENLIDIYNLAKDNDQVIQAAYQDNKAQLEAMPQAVALLLPTIAATSSSNGYNSKDPYEKYNTWGYGLTINQPIFQMKNWNKLSQAKDTVKKAFATLADAEQSLLLRVSQQYFAVLEAQDALNFAKAAQEAYAKQLEQSTQRYKVGLIAITDVLVAQATKDNAYAKVIAAENGLTNAKETLRVTVGKNIIKFATLKPTINLPSPNPINTEKWVELAIEKNWALQAARYDLALAKKQIQQARADNYPTVQFQYGTNNKKNPPSSPNIPSRSTQQQAAISLNMPIFSGGDIISKTRQAAYNYEKIKDTFEGAFRTTESNTRQAYNGVLTQLSQVKAYKQAVVSSESALKATQATYEVGTSTIVDVLLAQSNLINAEANYAKARSECILQSLGLKQTTGILSLEDLQEVNGWLEDK